eukprot:6098655-Pyramimonas_sp.AAC.1
MGHPRDRLDCSAATAVLDDPNLTKPQRGCLLAYLTQCLWARSRLAAAGYEIDQECECGHPTDAMQHRFNCQLVDDIKSDILEAPDLEYLRGYPSEAPLAH